MYVDATFVRIEAGVRITGACLVDTETMSIVVWDDDRWPTDPAARALILMPDDVTDLVVEGDDIVGVAAGALPGGFYLSLSDVFGKGDGGRSIERPTLEFYLPATLSLGLASDGTIVDLYVVVPPIAAPHSWNVHGGEAFATLMAANIGPDLDAFDALVEWEELPAGYLPALEALRTVVKIEMGWGPVFEEEIEDLLNYPTSSVRAYAEQNAWRILSSLEGTDLKE